MFEAFNILKIFRILYDARCYVVLILSLRKFGICLMCIALLCPTINCPTTVLHNMYNYCPQLGYASDHKYINRFLSRLIFNINNTIYFLNF